MEQEAAITFVEDAPIIIMHLGVHALRAFDLLNQPTVQERIRERIETTAGIDYFILDLTEVKASFSDLVLGLAGMRERIEAMGGRQYIEANLRYFICGTHELIGMMVEALQQEQYGGIETRRFDTLDQALSTARAELAARG